MNVVTTRQPSAAEALPNSAHYMRASDGRLVEYSPLQLLVMQSTPLCNIDCAYCYLPDRQNPKRMCPETVDAVYTDLITERFVGKQFTTVWHAGEPLTASIRFYADAVKSSRRLAERGCKVVHSIQTNATLVNDDWCEFFKESGVRIGVSIDGPADLHDRNRRSRSGQGTHSRVMQGVSLLRRHGIEFHVICVLTHHSLDYPDALIAFFASIGIQRLGLNIEEIEGANRVSSMIAPDSADALRRCLVRLHELATKEGIVIREFDSLRRYIYSGRYGKVNVQSLPFGVVSVDVEGNYSTFSPELLTMRHPRYGHFTFGNIHREPFSSILDSSHFRSVHSDIQAGTDRCRATCDYFGLCGGGAPSNKVFENGTFDSAETTYCRLAKKSVIDVVLPTIENELEIPLDEGDPIVAIAS
jgi:uncharacterized protein